MWNRQSTSPESPWAEHWNRAREELARSLPPESFNAYIAPLEISGAEDSGDTVNALLHAPNEMVRALAIAYRDTLGHALSRASDRVCRVEIAPSPSDVRDAVPDPLRPMDTLSPSSPARPMQDPRTRSARTEILDPGPSLQLYAGFRFENFVVGPSNQFAHAVAVAVAERPASAYNPLLFYSEPGLGKTHLLHAIGNYVLERRPHLKIGFFTAEGYVNDFVTSIQRNQMMEFRNRYRNYDLLLIDDIQFLGSKDRSQEEFFHTFNALIGSRKQVVLTSDKHPKEIPQLEERLRSRFEAGLISDIKPPEIETRIAILKNKAEHDDVYLPDEIATWIATHVKVNVRELEGALTKLKAQASFTGAEMTLELAKQCLGPMGEDSSLVSKDLIIAQVCRVCGIKKGEMLSVNREKRVLLPRQITMYLMKKYLQLPYKQIGIELGNKDHSTVMSAVRKIEEGIEGDPEIRELVDKIQALL